MCRSCSGFCISCIRCRVCMHQMVVLTIFSGQRGLENDRRFIWLIRQQNLDSEYVILSCRRGAPLTSLERVYRITVFRLSLRLSVLSDTDGNEALFEKLLLRQQKNKQRFSHQTQSFLFRGLCLSHVKFNKSY